MAHQHIESDICSNGIAGENLSAFELLELKACCNKANEINTSNSYWDDENAASFAQISDDIVIYTNNSKH